MRPLGEWDSAYLNELAHQNETAIFEKKAADGLTREKIAQGVCAFANSGEGFLAFGFKDEKAGGGLDTGVFATKGRQPIKDWAEALIPTLHQPPIEGCEARFIQHTSHTPERGVLVIAVPLSERRPHWTRDDEKACLRVGAHSAPMRPQTLLDISSRSVAPRGRVLGLGMYPKPGGWPENSGKLAFFVRPTICIEGGAVCELWGLELKVTRGTGHFHNHNRLLSDIQVTVTWDETLFFQGRQPLFPFSPRHAMPFESEAWVVVPSEEKELEITAKLFLASAIPVERRFRCEVGQYHPVVH